MNELVDISAREQIHKVHSELQGLAADYWGPLKDNGFRSRIIRAEVEIETIKGMMRSQAEKLRSYMDREREATCLGLAELAKRDRLTEKANEEDTQVEVAKIQAGATLGAADRAGKAAIWREWIILIGICLSLLVSVLK